MAKHNPFRFALFALCLVASTSLIAMSVRGAISRPFIFPAPDYRYTPALPNGRMVTVRGERTVYGYYAKAGNRLVVFFHGNGEVMGSMQDIAAEMLRQGMSVLLAEYPGYGFASAYPASEENLYTDAQLLLENIQQENKHSKEDTILWGFSLGTGVAVEMARRGLGGLMILMAPFTSMVELAAKHFTPIARVMIVDRFDNAAKAASISIPVLILHGDSDQIIPVAQARQLARLFPRARYIEIAGADHNDLMQHMNREIWRQVFHFAAGR